MIEVEFLLDALRSLGRELDLLIWLESENWEGITPIRNVRS